MSRTELTYGVRWKRHWVGISYNAVIDDVELENAQLQSKFAPIYMYGMVKLKLCLLISHTPWRHMGKGIVVSFTIPAPYPGETSVVPIWYEAGWAPESRSFVWDILDRARYRSCDIWQIWPTPLDVFHWVCPVSFWFPVKTCVQTPGCIFLHVRKILFSSGGHCCIYYSVECHKNNYI
jgi:hypothetical protein